MLYVRMSARYVLRIDVEYRHFFFSFMRCSEIRILFARTYLTLNYLFRVTVEVGLCKLAVWNLCFILMELTRVVCFSYPFITAYTFY